jgi:hypothetical protein
MVFSTVGALISLVLLAKTGAHVPLLFSLLFMVHFFNNALITLTVGPLCSESVPAGLMATASGVVIAVGELFGGGVAPVLVGQVHHDGCWIAVEPSDAGNAPAPEQISSGQTLVESAPGVSNDLHQIRTVLIHLHKGAARVFGLIGGGLDHLAEGPMKTMTCRSLGNEAEMGCGSGNKSSRC